MTNIKFFIWQQQQTYFPARQAAFLIVLSEYNDEILGWQVNIQN